MEKRWSREPSTSKHKCPGRRHRAALMLRPFDVFLVGAHCSLVEIERRERLRGNRKFGGGRSHVEEDRIHDFDPMIARSKQHDNIRWMSRLRSYNGGASDPSPFFEQRQIDEKS